MGLAFGRYLRPCRQMPRTPTGFRERLGEAPTAGLWRIVAALVDAIDGPLGRIDQRLDVSAGSLHGLRRMEHLDYLAYWEWCLAELRPGSVVMQTPVGELLVPLVAQDPDYIGRQLLRRERLAIGAGCTPDSARRNAIAGRQAALDQLALPLKAGSTTGSDPIGLLADLLQLREAVPNNLTVATGATIVFIEHVLDRRPSKSTQAIRLLWDIASRLGCTMTITWRRHRASLTPSLTPNPELIADIASAIAAPSPSLPDADPDVVAIASGRTTVMEVAAQRGCSPQAVHARVRAAGIRLRVSSHDLRLDRARQTFRRLRARSHRPTHPPAR